jgi:hypothetical protein
MAAAGPTLQVCSSVPACEVTDEFDLTCLRCGFSTRVVLASVPIPTLPVDVYWTTGLLRHRVPQPGSSRRRRVRPGGAARRPHEAGERAATPSPSYSAPAPSASAAAGSANSHSHRPVPRPQVARRPWLCAAPSQR